MLQLEKHPQILMNKLKLQYYMWIIVYINS